MITRRPALVAATLPLIAPPARAQGTEVAIGLVLPFTGATGSYGPDTKKAAGMGNEAGGVLGGRKLRLFIEDEETSATAAVVATRKLKAAHAANGGTVTETVLYNPNQLSYRAGVEHAFGPEPDAVLCLSLLTDMVGIVKEDYRGGFKSRILGRSTEADVDDACIKTAGPELSQGILNIPRSPQGRPVIVQAGSSGRGRVFAARWSEVIFAWQIDMARMRAFAVDTFETFVDRVVPLLQRAGRVPTAYRGLHLRDHLGLTAGIAC